VRGCLPRVGPFPVRCGVKPTVALAHFGYCAAQFPKRCFVSLKIALIPPLFECVPPRFYGGTERIVAALADALVALGHAVTLFATADARTSAELVPVRECALRLDSSHLVSDTAAHLSMLDEVRRRASQFDVLHFHTDMLHFPLFNDIAERTVTTIHGRLDMKDLAETYRRWPRYPLVSISHQQRRPLPFANWCGTVHHGLLLQQYAFCGATPGSYLAFLGRISPEKRPDRAIAIAKRAGMPLKIAAKIDNTDRAYYHEAIEPLLKDPLVEYVGEIGDGRKSEFLGRAAALVFPIDWPEPFGLVMIEAMACGTPVIAYNCGSVPEVVDDGVTGLIVNDEDEAVAAVQCIADLDRRRIRKTCERRFSAEAMARRYVRIYARLRPASRLSSSLLQTAD
jgi:glycosyltransferase involved in cell wall biosynthesis